MDNGERKGRDSEDTRAAKPRKGKKGEMEGGNEREYDSHLSSNILTAQLRLY